MVKPLPLKLEDETAERVRRSHHDAIEALQSASAMTVLSGVTLADGVATTIAHKLGRAPALVCPGAPRNAVTAGLLVEVRSGSQDSAKVIVLKASGFGATITVDVGLL